MIHADIYTSSPRAEHCCFELKNQNNIFLSIQVSQAMQTTLKQRACHFKFFLKQIVLFISL